MVSDKALGIDQGQKYLLVVDEHNTVKYCRVEAGPLQDDGLRVIKKGLQPGQWVIVSGLQLVRPQMKVEKEETSMLPVAQRSIRRQRRRPSHRAKQRERQRNSVCLNPLTSCPSPKGRGEHSRDFTLLH